MQVARQGDLIHAVLEMTASRHMTRVQSQSAQASGQGGLIQAALEIEEWHFWALKETYAVPWWFRTCLESFSFLWKPRESWKSLSGSFDVWKGFGSVLGPLG